MSVSINNVNAYSGANYQAEAINKNTAKINEKAVADDKTVTAAEGGLKTDTYEKSPEAAAAQAEAAAAETENAGKFEVDIDALIEQNNQRVEAFHKMLMSMITKQGEKSNVSIFGMDLNVPQAKIEEAQAAIAEGGEWSVNAVADRIMNFAYAISGGDESKIQLLKDAALKGFYEAGFDPEDRSTMPEITGQTYDEVVSRFEDWEKNGMRTYNNTDFDNAVNNETEAADTAENSGTVGIIEE